MYDQIVSSAVRYAGHLPTAGQVALGGLLSVFLAPICGNEMAQVAVVCFFLFSFLDMAAGGLAAWFLQHDYSSHEMREGIVRKLLNALIVCAAYIVDVMLIAGLDLSGMPFPVPSGSVLTMFAVAFCIMEMTSLAEIWAESHPDDHDSPVWQMLVHSKDSLKKVE